MKGYGKKAVETAGHHRRGTSRPCPCCVTKVEKIRPHAVKARARQEAKFEICKEIREE